MRLGFITTVDLSRYFPDPHDPLLTHDDAALASYLRGSGIDVSAVPWDLSQHKGEELDALIVRSPWGFMDSHASIIRFLAYLDSFPASIVHNHPSIIRWNLDKHYLATLEGWGLPIVPSTFIGRDAPLSRAYLRGYLSEVGPFVMKPAISAAAKDTFLIRDPKDIENLSSLNGHVGDDFETWRDNRSFIIQPFLSSVTSVGEWSLVFIDGSFVHAVLKRPASGQWLVQDELGGSVLSGTPPRTYVDLATSTARMIDDYVTRELGLSHKPLYLRVDLLLHEESPVIGEIELIEPELFFLQRTKSGPRLHEPSVHRFAQAIRARLQ